MRSVNSKLCKKLRRLAEEIEPNPEVVYFYQPRFKTVFVKGEPVQYRSLQLRLKPTCQKALYRRAKRLYRSTSGTPDQMSI